MSEKSEEGMNESPNTTLMVPGTIFVISVILFLFRQIVLGPFYRKKNRIDGKVVIITGCNTGIGKVTALELAKRGGRIYMACRDPKRCETARLEIVEKSKNPDVFNRTLDLSSFESIKKFVDKFLQEESRLDILINNAGVMASPRELTKDGFEQQFGINHLGHFYLTNLLLDTLKASAPSRIVVVSSFMQYFGQIKKDDINSEKSYSRIGAYNQSKLANVLFTRQLTKILKGTGATANCLHPGAVRTELQRHVLTNKFIRLIVQPIILYLFKTPEAGAQTSIRLAIDPSLEDVSGNFYFDTYFRAPIQQKAKDPQMAEWLWKVSEEMTGFRSTSEGSRNTVKVDSELKRRF